MSHVDVNITSVAEEMLLPL